MSHAAPVPVPAEPAWKPDDPHGLRLLLLTGGIRLGHVMSALAELEIADHLAQGPRPVAVLADAAGADTDALRRLLRCAASVGVFEELPGDRFTLTPLAHGLRSDTPGSVRQLSLYNGMELLWRSYSEILHTVRTGRPATPQALGATVWEYLGARPETATRVYDILNGMNLRLQEEYLASVDPVRFHRIADIGGGDGAFLSALLRRSPDATGVLFELPERMAQTRHAVDGYGCADRVTLAPGDFRTDPLPTGCDAYVLKGIIHNWDDDSARTILRGVRAAIGDSGARLFVIEQVAAPPNTWDFGRFIDIDLLLIFGGRMRGVEDWRRLAADTGFELVSDPVTGKWTTLECHPV